MRPTRYFLLLVCGLAAGCVGQIESTGVDRARVKVEEFYIVFRRQHLVGRQPFINPQRKRVSQGHGDVGASQRRFIEGPASVRQSPDGTVGELCAKLEGIDQIRLGGVQVE